VAKQPLRSLMANNAVTEQYLIKDPIIGGAGRTSQLLADHPHNVADDTEKRGRKSDED